MPQTLTLGSKGQDVELLQTILNSHPPTTLPLLLVDGDFGPVTLERVKEFQRNNGLFIDGVVGSITWDKLLSHEEMPLQLRINPAAVQHPISPLIYGINAFEMNDTDFGALNQAIKPSVVRWGGNKTTRYNWENDFTNTGNDFLYNGEFGPNDYYYENVPCNNPDRSELPNNSAADRERLPFGCTKIMMVKVVSLGISVFRRRVPIRISWQSMLLNVVAIAPSL